MRSVPAVCSKTAQHSIASDMATMTGRSVFAFLLAEVVLALQATMLSLVPPEVIPPSDTCKGVSPSALQPLLSWFQHTFQQLPPALPQSPDEDDFAGKADGLDSVTEQLQAVAAAKQGSAEQLQALFVSLCRAQALLVRSVRCELSEVKIQSTAVFLYYVLHCSSPYTAWFCGCLCALPGS